MRGLLKSPWIIAFLGLTACYFAIPQMLITDSRYVIAIADLLLRTGGLDMRPLVRADKGLPLPVNNQILVRANDLPPEMIPTLNAVKIWPVVKPVTFTYYYIYDIFANVPSAAGVLKDSPPRVLPFFPTWPAFAALPISLITAAINEPVFDGTTFHEDRNEKYQKIAAAMLVAVSVCFFYATARCLVAWPFALGLAAWLASGPLVSSTSRALWSDTFALPLCFAGLYIFSRVVFVDRPTRHWPIALGTLLSLAFVMKPSYAIPDAMMGVLILLAPNVSLRLKVHFIAVCAVCAALFVATSVLIYGEPLPPYFSPSRGASFEFSRLMGILFSPGRGVLWFMPSMLVACSAPFFVRRDRTFFVASIAAITAIIAAFRSIAGFQDWWGGHSYGPRILQFALPASALLALLLVHAASQRAGRERIAILALCGAIAGWEGFVHISGAISRRGFEWNSKPVDVNIDQRHLWDWSDPQFLAAFQPTQPMGGIAELPKDGWVSMASACSDRFAGDGVSGREPEFRWTDGDRAVILFAGAPENADRFAIELRPLLDAPRSAQHVNIALNGVEIGAAVLTRPQWTRLQFDVPPGILKTVNIVTLKLPDAHTPSEGTQERRRLGVAIRKFVVTAEPDASSLPIAGACR
jgi:hypothetical protein